MAHWQSDPHPSASNAGSDRGTLQSVPSGSKRVSIAPAPYRARPQFPSQAGTSCEAGASTARTWDGQPSPKRFWARVRRHGQGGVDVGLPTVPAPFRSHAPQTPLSGIGPHGRRGHGHPRRGAGGAARAGLRDLRPGPASRFRGVKGPNSHLKPQTHTESPPNASTSSSPKAPTCPRTRHPRIACTLSVLTLHVVGKDHFYQHVA